MAIVDAEPKKSEVDVTSTGSSSGSKEMKNPRGPIKYSSLKDFSSSVSDVWDDRNICTFIECCHANFEDLKTHNGSDDYKVWEKITKSGLKRSGSINCFSVNYCLELAKCLKSFVSKNEKKMMDNDIFKLLYDNVVDLLPYFAPVNPSRHRSPSKSVENSKSEQIELQQNTKSDHLTIPPFGTSSESTQVLRKVAKILNKYKIDEFVETTSRTAIWKEVTANVEKDFGVLVDPRTFLEGYKRSVVGFVRSRSDPKERENFFLEQIDDLLPFFDYIEPRSMKKSEFLSPAVEATAEKELVVANVESKKRKEPEEENPPDDSSSPKTQKRLNSGGESVADSGDIPLTTNTTTPLRTHLKKKTVSDCDTKAKKSKYGEDSDESCSEALDFLNEWDTSSTDDLIEQPQEKESEKAPIESEPAPVEAPVAKSPTPDPTPPVKKVLPSGQGTQSKKDTQVTVPQKEQAKQDSQASPPVSSSKELVPAARVLPVPLRKEKPPEDKDPGGSTKHKTNDKKKDTGHFVIPGEMTRLDPRESEDPEIEDVPLMGTNIRVHTVCGKVEQSKSHFIEGNMNPVVLLYKISTDNYFPSSSSAQSKPISRSNHTRGKRAKSTENSREPTSRRGPTPQVAVPSTVTAVERRKPGRPKKTTITPLNRRAKSTENSCEPTSRRGPTPQVAVPSTVTAVERRKPGRPKKTTITPTVTAVERRKPGRPKKTTITPLIRTRAVPPCSDPTPVISTSSAELVRQTVRTTAQPLDRNSLVRQLESRPSTVQSRHLVPMSPPSTSHSENFVSRTNPDPNPPEWFGKFVMETRRHEMWKAHQLMKMQRELMDCGSKRSGVLEKILSALNEISNT